MLKTRRIIASYEKNQNVRRAAICAKMNSRQETKISLRYANVTRDQDVVTLHYRDKRPKCR